MPEENEGSVHRFAFDGEDTCKRTWTFTVRGVGAEAHIAELNVVERPLPEGCTGHARTIVALLTGARLATLDVDALEATVCERSLSCGQALGRCLRDLRERHVRG